MDQNLIQMYSFQRLVPNLELWGATGYTNYVLLKYRDPLEHLSNAYHQTHVVPESVYSMFVCLCKRLGKGEQFNPPKCCPHDFFIIILAGVCGRKLEIHLLQT